MTLLRLILLFAITIVAQVAIAQRPDAKPPTLGKALSPVHGKGPCSSNAVPPGSRLRSIVASIFERSSGRRVAGLKADDFLLAEGADTLDAALFEYPDAPLTAVLLFDTSPSTFGKLSEMGRAATDLMSALRPRDRISIYSFDGEITRIVGPSKIADVGNERITVARRAQGTRLYDAVHRVLSSNAIKDEGKKVIIIFTDGDDTLSNNANRKLALDLASENDAMIYALQHPKVGNVPKGEPDAFLSGLAEATGGRVMMVGSMEEAAKGLAKIPDEVRGQYVLCFLDDESCPADKVSLKLRSPKPGQVLNYRVY